MSSEHDLEELLGALSGRSAILSMLGGSLGRGGSSKTPRKPTVMESDLCLLVDSRNSVELEAKLIKADGQIPDWELCSKCHK